MGFQSGDKNPNWKGGKTTTSKGYIRFSAGANRHKLEHRVLWEEKHGPIPKGFDVHHKNEIRNDNRDENFELRPALRHRTEVITKINTRKRKALTENGLTSYHCRSK